MQALESHEQLPGKILCCECGELIEPNAANICVACVRARVDITEGIPRQNRLTVCKACERCLVPPNSWIHAERESKELLSVLLKKLKPSMSKVRLVDASFVWTEPHSKREKVKLTIQKEVMNGAVLQQSFVVEFVVINQMCEDCHRIEAKDYWRACVQVRQKCDFKKTLFYLEQLLVKYRSQLKMGGVKPVATGIDFFYPDIQAARKLVDFIMSSLPCKCHYAQELVSHDPKNNTYDYKHTFCVEVVPICRDNVICLPKKVAQSLGNMGQVAVCLRISNVISIIDPATLQFADITATQYWRDPFPPLCHPKQLTEYYVLDIEDVEDLKRAAGHGHISTRHCLADAWVVPSDMVGQDDQKISARTHLGFLLKPGDLVLGFDIRNSNVNSPLLDAMKPDDVPDVILVRKVYDKSKRRQRRNWKLKRLIEDGDGGSVETEFENFMEDLEEDEQMRSKINIYRDHQKQIPVDSDDMDDDLPNAPTLNEMLEDLDLEDVEMSET